MNSFFIIVAIVFTIVVVPAFARPVYRSLRIEYLIVCHADFAAATRHFEAAIEVRRRVQAPEHPRFAKLLELYATSLDGIGKTAEAREHRERAAYVQLKPTRRSITLVCVGPVLSRPLTASKNVYESWRAR
jgi:hypothetical protein